MGYIRRAQRRWSQLKSAASAENDVAVKTDLQTSVHTEDIS